jgi:hypothetical protein
MMKHRCSFVRACEHELPLMKKSKRVLTPEKLFADVVECNDALGMDKMDNALHSMMKNKTKK